ncbi:unnamed protein product [Adineta ricciae]|uniref:Uncharacterized protein n=1 Tax=Adineta ricciae TaxID=249248 RepID=A0A815ULZ6_ADIRI|nr:unnamed protein product [Adineta ricciae]CAF1520934.1 unnamed protein product [Adineta ricciae]
MTVLNKQGNLSREMMSYCISELSSEISMENNDNLSKFTFEELSNENITSEQLYLWSIPFDIIEYYQLYLNELLLFNKSSLSQEILYNCTFPRFGSMCQYEFDHYNRKHSSLIEIIDDFYLTYEYKMNNLTCYTHLECNRGFSSICLDWTEICNGRIDCFDTRIDEQDCWQLEINECNENEYRCTNGQCIPLSFFRDDLYLPDCLDRSDEYLAGAFNEYNGCNRAIPSFACEDSRCQRSTWISSCWSQRDTITMKNMLSEKDELTSDRCWNAFLCDAIALHKPSRVINCADSCENESCKEIIEFDCPDMILLSNIPILFGDIYFLYEKYKSTVKDSDIYKYPYLCYNNSLYDRYFQKLSKQFGKYSIIKFNNRICHRVIIPLIIKQARINSVTRVYITMQLRNNLWQYQQIYNYNSFICKRSNMYQCINSSKCISIYRLKNSIVDCPDSDDEDDISLNRTAFSSGTMGKSDYLIKIEHAKRHVSFQTICDGFTELLPIQINGQDHTDETECEHWACDNIYTHCNNLMNCPNGADETNCHLPSPFNCSSNEFPCVSPITNQFMCISTKQVNDGTVDCLGATDEPRLCRTDYDSVSYDNNFYCENPNSQSCLTNSVLCNYETNCFHGEDEQFCTTNIKEPVFSICSTDNRVNATVIEKFLCNQTDRYLKEPIIYFKLNDQMNISDDKMKSFQNKYLPSIQKFNPCHRGIAMQLWLNKNTTKIICFCPSSYYGSQCQYQNERISLSIRFQASPNSLQILFEILILLIDDENMIHSYEQFTYLSVRDCAIKHHISLTYANQRKNSSKNYQIRIDIYEKSSFNYRGSFLFPIKFSFLPVCRLPVLIHIPNTDRNIESCSMNPCQNGLCRKYLNNKQEFFCQCSKHWTGQYCTRKYLSKCSNDSLYIGISSNNQSICICSMNKYGSRCFLKNRICENSSCLNNGECIPTDKHEFMKKKFSCICRKGFIGEYCQTNETKIIISFNKNILLPSSIFLHFIEIRMKDYPLRSTTFQTISIQEKFLTIFWSSKFHLIFVEFYPHKYYLVSNNRSEEVTEHNRCLHINQLFNQSISELKFLRRIKYYHLLCQSNVLSCFYDEIHLCICYDFNQKHLANCFDFVHNMTYDCFGQNDCQNNGKCFQDTENCPKKFICFCTSCFYGKLCQFTTTGFSLTLDNILAYHIQTNVNIFHQLNIIRISMILNIIIVLIGLINGILSLITFKNKIIREVGCGLYLFSSSITTLLIIILFTLKFWIFILAQIYRMNNRLFLQIQCSSLDFLLRICLNMDQWLNASVACERVITINKGTRFDKKKSRQIAKYVLVILLIFNILTSIHDPIYRRLIDEEKNDENNEKRIWCIVSYSSHLHIYDNTINTLHLFLPFLINLISAIILLVMKTHHQSNIQKERTFREIFRKNYRQHRHLLLAPVVLVILALPRLIISFTSKCMKSNNDSWLFLAGYFISFTPPTLSCIIFILPSKFYKEEFHKSINEYRRTIQRRLQFNS